MLDDPGTEVTEHLQPSSRLLCGPSFFPGFYSQRSLLGLWISEGGEAWSEELLPDVHSEGAGSE